MSNLEDLASSIGKEIEDRFKLLEDSGFIIESCCGQHLQIVHEASDVMMYEINRRWFQ